MGSALLLALYPATLHRHEERTMSYTLVTNHKPVELQRLCDLPAKIAAEFDYIEHDGAEFDFRLVQYRGSWYDVHDMQRIEPDSGRAHLMDWAMRVHPGEPLASFDCVTTDTYFSGVAFRFVDSDGADDDGRDTCVVCARFYG